MVRLAAIDNGEWPEAASRFSMAIPGVPIFVNQLT
jgi:hypothetical protein